MHCFYNNATDNIFICKIYMIMYLYAKDPYEAKYQLLINKLEKVGLDCFDDPKVFIEYSNDMRDVYKNTEEYNPGKENKVLIVFDDISILD